MLFACLQSTELRPQSLAAAVPPIVHFLFSFKELLEQV